MRSFGSLRLRKAVSPAPPQPLETRCAEVGSGDVAPRDTAYRGDDIGVGEGLPDLDALKSACNIRPRHPDQLGRPDEGPPLLLSPVSQSHAAI